jgi:hypothetical protein
MGSSTFLTGLAFLLCVTLTATCVEAGDDASAPAAPASWGITIWGLSYHLDQSIDYAAANYGAGVRYYLARHVFVEGDVLRNSNRGVVLPVSVGVEVPAGSIGACHVAAIGAVTLAWYQNLRTASDYFRAGPVPGASFTCGRFQPNVVVILSPSHQPVAAIAASLTIRL